MKAIQLPCFVALVVLVFPVQSARGDLKQTIQDINKQATAARQTLDLGQVEKLRLKRLDLLASSAESSPWTAGRKAIKEADDLIRGLKYKQACELLRKAWGPFAKAPSEPVFGDIALKMFETTQAALVVYPDALNENSPNGIASEKEVRDAIQLAVDQDPCQIEAWAILAHLIRPDPKEAFTRAEVRASLRARNQRLLNLSYSSGEVMPWHAPVEMLKAESTATVLDDLDYSQSFLGAPSTTTLVGWDAGNAPFHLVYGRLLLMEVPGADDRPTPSLIHLDRRSSRKADWKKLNLHVLWCRPARADSTGGPADRSSGAGETNPENPDVSAALIRSAVTRQLLAMKPIGTWQLGQFALALYDMPTVKPADSVSALPFLGVAQLASIQEAARRHERERQTAKTDAAVAPALSLSPNQILRQWTDWTFLGEGGGSAPPSPSGGQTAPINVPLVDPQNAKSPEGNLLLVLSEDGGGRFTPPFFTDGPMPYLQLIDGLQLAFDEKNCEFVIQYPAVAGHIPLDATSVPDAVLLATSIGAVIASDLTAAGYPEADVAKELRKAVENPRYVPAKLKRSARPDGPAQSVDQEWASRMEALRAQALGLRYLVDSRGNRITASRLLAQGEAGQGRFAQFTPAEGEGGFVYRMFSPTGTELRDRDTRYSEADWKDLYRNIVGDFLPRASWLQPCPPLWRKVDQELARPLLGSSQNVGGSPVQPFSSPPSPQMPQPTQAPPEGAPDGGQPAAPAALGTAQVTARVRQEFGTLVQARDSQTRSLFFRVYYRQAGREASAGDYHRAILYYQDVAQELGSAGRLNDAFFREVPSAERIQKFAGDLESYIAAQEFSIIVQAEQAAVLCAAGLDESADFLRTGLIDQFQLYTLPMIDEAVRYAQSYGYSPSPAIGGTRQRIESHLTQIMNTPTKRGTLSTIVEAFGGRGSGSEPAYVRQAIQPPDADPSFKTRLEAIRKQLAAKSQPGDKAAPATQVSVGRLIEELQSLSRPVSDWLAEKELYRDRLPEYLMRADNRVLPLNRTCPVDTYDEANGFAGDLRALLREGLANELAQWAALPPAKAAEDPNAGKMNFLLGWYWLDRGNPTYARVAFIAGARACLAQAAKPGLGLDAKSKADAITGLVAKRNAMMLMLAAASVTDTPPGVNVAQTHYVDELRIHMLMWKRQCGSLGLPERHVQKESADVDFDIDSIRAADRRGGEATGERYFWFDYDAPPDVLVAKSMQRRLYQPDQPDKNLPAGPTSLTEVLNADFNSPRSFDGNVISLCGK